MPSFIMWIAGLGFWAMVLCGCESKPSRKKLPDFTGLQGWENMPLARTEKKLFLTSDTTIMEGSRLTSFLSVSMPDPICDSLAITMATNYEPLAATLIEEWAKQGRKGILVDLRSKAGNEDYRAEFVVKKNLPDNGNIAIPLIFIWDRASAYREDYLTKLLTAMPEIKCDLISDSHNTEGKGRNDCFSPATPSFDQ